MKNFKILSWNVNGFRAIIKKKYIQGNTEEDNNNFENFVKSENPDIVTLCETKLNDPIYYDKVLPDYPFIYHSHCTKTKGRNGVVAFSKFKPLNVINSLKGIDEGRYLELEFPKFYLVSVYQPNSGDKLQRLEFRTETWDPLLLKRLSELKSKKHVILCGDLNVVSSDLDTSNYLKQLNRQAGVTEKEIANFHKLLNSDFVDTAKDHTFTYFSYYTHGRKSNKGMRIDYFLVDKKAKRFVLDNEVLQTAFGSDHLPILLTLKKGLIV